MISTLSQTQTQQINFVGFARISLNGLMQCGFLSAIQFNMNNLMLMMMIRLSLVQGQRWNGYKELFQKILNVFLCCKNAECLFKNACNAITYGRICTSPFIRKLLQSRFSFNILSHTLGIIILQPFFSLSLFLCVCVLECITRHPHCRCVTSASSLHHIKNLGIWPFKDMS